MSFSELDPEVLGTIVESSEFSATQSGLVDLVDLVVGTVDVDVPARLVVPVDVQALVVPTGGLNDESIRLPFALTRPNDEPAEATPLPFKAEPIKREPGVHLHWALPDALLRANMTESEDGEGVLDLTPLPDLWVVLRVTIPKDAVRVHVHGFVIDANTATVTSLAKFNADGNTGTAFGRKLEPGELHAVAGGSLAWTGGYDATFGRFAMHDPLDDLDDIAPDGFETDRASYVVAGVWSRDAEDLIKSATTRPALDVVLAELGWKIDGAEDDRLNTVVDDSTQAVSQPFVSTGSKRAARLSVDSRFSEIEKVVSNADFVLAPLVEPPKTALFHGVVHGVPLDKPRGDNRPPKAAMTVALGSTEEAAMSSLIAPGADADSREEKAAIEETLAAFSGQLLDKLGEPDGIASIDQSEHRSGFTSKPGPDSVIDTYRVGGESGYLTAGRQARALEARLVDIDPSAGGRTSGRTPAARRRKNRSDRAEFAALPSLADDRPFQLQASTAEAVAQGILDTRGLANRLTPTEFTNIPESRSVERAGPRFYTPLEPLVLVSGARRSLRHGGDGRFSVDGLLSCRMATELETEYKDLLTGPQVVSPIRVSGVPTEVNELVQEAVMTSPFFLQWLAKRAAAKTKQPVGDFEVLFAAEAALRYGHVATYDGQASLPPIEGLPTAESSPSLLAAHELTVGSTRANLSELVFGYSQLGGSEPDPVGVTVWNGQPWIPLWLEWEVEFDYSKTLDGWTLDTVDFEISEGEGPTFDTKRIVRGRSLLTKGPAVALASAIDEWLKGEAIRDSTGDGVTDPEEEDRLADIANSATNLDMVSTTLSSFHEALLGIVTGSGEDPLVARNGDGKLEPISPVALPELLVSGRLRLTNGRLVDAFGRVQDLPTSAAISESDRPSDNANVLQLAPRFTIPARWQMTLVDAADLGPDPEPAVVHQLDNDLMVNPVAGFLLPDHIDEALEVFDRHGDPLGQLTHEAFGGAVTWQVAPGRPLPVDSPPDAGLDSESQMLGLLASSLLDVDADQRGGLPRGEGESPLSAMLRAIDTTLWSVDTFGSLGSEHIAGLVGRPIAVVRATLALDLEEDLEFLNLSSGSDEADRQGAYDALARQEFAVRLGEITRTDDGLLGFFVNDDYTNFHLVDRIVEGLARESGRQVGHLGIYGKTAVLPELRPIENGYIAAEDEVTLRYGQQVSLTLLMHAGGRVHYTSGVVPRRFVQLQRDWVAPGLARLAPSVRVGPVLVDADQVRLPLISSLGQGQLWSRRVGPTEWRDDPILAATQSALLPEMPAQVQEGYIRVTPEVEGK